MSVEHRLIAQQIEAIANLVQELGCTETRLMLARKKQDRARRLLGDRTEFIDQLRAAALDALSPIEEAINALAGYGIEIPGLNAAHADLRSAAE